VQVVLGLREAIFDFWRSFYGNPYVNTVSRAFVLALCYSLQRQKKYSKKKKEKEKRKERPMAAAL